MNTDQVLPLDKLDMSIDISISYREQAIEYSVVLRNDSPQRIEPITIYPAVQPQMFVLDREYAILGPLSGGESASTTFLLSPNEDFYNLVLAKGIIEGRDIDVTSTIRSRRGMITCDVHLKNKRRIPIKALEVSPLAPPGYASPIKSRIVDLGSLESRKVTFNLVPEKLRSELERKATRYVPFTPRFRRLAPPGIKDLPQSVEVEVEPPHPYARMECYNPAAMCSSRSVRGLIMAPEVREALRIEETTPEEIEIKHVPKVKREISEGVSRQTPKSAQPSRKEEEPLVEVDRDVAPEEVPPEEEMRPEEDAGPEEGPQLDEVAEKKYPCAYCGMELKFIEQYQRWYCYSCKRYA
jgi:hypothetical protein